MNFEDFPFYKLNTLGGLDYEQIRCVANVLLPYIKINEFYTNYNNCMDQTLDFIMNYSSYLIKPNNGNDQVLLILLKLLKNIIIRIGINKKQHYLISHQQRILGYLNHCIDNSSKSVQQLEIDEISVELLNIYNFADNNMKNISGNIKDFVVKCCKLFKTNGDAFQLTRLIRIILEREFFSPTKAKHFMTWIENNCVNMLKQVDNCNHIFELLKCIIICYKLNEAHSEISNLKLQELLVHFFKYRQSSSLRTVTEDILWVVVRDHYLNDTYIWPGGESALLDAIRNLPEHYDNWPNSGADIFFVLAYLQLVNGRSIWETDAVLNAIGVYFWKHPVPSRIILKALLFLYPILIGTLLDKGYCYINDMLINILKTTKSLSNLIVFHPLQLLWLVKKSDLTLRCRIINYWLMHKTDEDIVNALLKTKMEYLLLPLLSMNVATNERHRISSIIQRLFEDSQVDTNNCVLLPLISKNPTIFSMLHKKTDMDSWTPNERISALNTVTRLFPHLADVTVIPELVTYCLVLFKKLKNPSSGLKLFCHHPATIKILTACCYNTEETIAIAAINMINYIITIQVRHKIQMPYSVEFNFIKFLYLHPKIVQQGLDLLSLTLLHKDQLLINQEKHSRLGLFHILINFAVQELCASQILQILKVLLSEAPELALSQSIKYCIFDLCVKNLDSQTKIFFLNFLREWLVRLEEFPKQMIPVNYIKTSLAKSTKYKNLCASINAMLDKYL